eukprot:4234103-Amphidinium_carterae.1
MGRSFSASTCSCWGAALASSVFRSRGALRPQVCGINGRPRVLLSHGGAVRIFLAAGGNSETHCL